jgi:hypothetical protein
MGLLDHMDNLPIPCLCQMSVSVYVALSSVSISMSMSVSVSELVPVLISTLLNSVVLYISRNQLALPRSQI